MPEQGLGRHEDERLAEGQRDLTPQDVEQRRGRRAVRHDPVSVVQLPHCSPNIIHLMKISLIIILFITVGSQVR